MIDGIIKQICALIGLLEEKFNQLCEVVKQQEAIKEKLQVLLDPDAELPLCPVVEHRWRFDGFDLADGVFDEGYIHQTTVNGVDVDTPRDPAWTTKGQHYADTVSAVNAASAGMGMTLITDQPITANNSAPTYEVVVPVGETLEIINRHTGTVRTFGTAEDGVSCISTFQDAAGNDIGSNDAVEQ